MCVCVSHTQPILLHSLFHPLGIYFRYTFAPPLFSLSKHTLFSMYTRLRLHSELWLARVHVPKWARQVPNRYQETNRRRLNSRGFLLPLFVAQRLLFTTNCRHLQSYWRIRAASLSWMFDHRHCRRFRAPAPTHRTQRQADKLRQ